MADRTSIEWTDATWNPITGCTIVSPGCTNCYAMRLAGTRLAHTPSRTGLTNRTRTGPVWNGKVRFNEQWLTQPLSWRKPRRIFVCAHGDLFAEGVEEEWLDRIFAVMALCPQHVFQVLTKRPGRMFEYMAPRDTLLRIDRRLAEMTSGTRPDPAPNWPLPNVWLGVSVEDQRRADERIPTLLATPAAVRWISAEPLLGPVSLQSTLGGTLWMGGQRGCGGMHHGIGTPECPRHPHHHHDERCKPGLDWVVAGGESGHGARPMHPDWARSLRDQCAAAEVPFFFKQWGEYMPNGQIDASGRPWTVETEIPGHQPCIRLGKKAAGRNLDGRTHDDMPEAKR